LDTIGSCIDKLFTVNLKYHNKKDLKSKNNLLEQRNELLREINQLFDEVKNSDRIKCVKPQHKIY
jgi:hypothetical protein